MDLLDFSPNRFVEHWLSLGRRRAYFVYDEASSTLRPSHDELRHAALDIQGDDRDFDRHEAMFLEIGRESRALFGAFLHRTVRGQGQGGLRNWSYPTLRAFLTDGLRLAEGMGRKNALSGLWWGGGKGVLARPEHDVDRRTLYREYGEFITSLRGAYVTAEDVGTNAEDMAEVYSTTRFVTCVPPAVGGSGNPSFATARGVVCAMEGALAELGLGELRGKTIAVQGLGNVGFAMVSELFARGVARVIASDIDESRVHRAQKAFADSPFEGVVAAPGDNTIFTTPCDVLAPNALGGILRPATIELLQTRVVCGAANNQLLDDRRDDALLAQRGITYVPDFVANRMGIVNCANEQYGSVSNDPAIERHFDASWDGSVHQTVRRVLALAKTSGVTSTQAANQLADELSNVPHPIWGDRARTIVNGLVEDHWHLADS